MPLPSPRIIAAIIFVVMVLLMITLGPAACNKIRSMGLQHRMDQGQLGASQNSAVDAIKTQGEVSRNEVSASDLTRRNAEEIDNAKDANTHAPAAYAASLRALCARPINRDRERCRVHRADPH